MAWTPRTRGTPSWSTLTRGGAGWNWDFRWLVTLGVGPAIVDLPVSIAMRGLYPSGAHNSWGKRGVSTATWTKR